MLTSGPTPSSRLTTAAHRSVRSLSAPPQANLALDSGDRGQRCSDKTQPSTLGVELATGLPAFRVAYSFGGVLTAHDVVTSLHQDCQGLGPVEARLTGSADLG